MGTTLAHNCHSCTQLVKDDLGVNSYLGDLIRSAAIQYYLCLYSFI